MSSHTQMKYSGRKTLRFAFVKSLPIMAGYLVLGAGFGMLLESKGYGPLWALGMSVFIYAGSMQYVCIDLMTGGASLLRTALMTLMVNARHMFYGISMLNRYAHAGKKKPYLVFSLTDETYSLVCSGEVPEGVDQKLYFFLVSLFDQIYWVAGSLIGSLFGSILTINTEGIDFAMTALFLVVFVDQWMEEKSHFSALIGLSASVACLLIFGPDSFLIPSMAVIIAALLLAERSTMGRETGPGCEAELKRETEPECEAGPGRSETSLSIKDRQEKNDENA